PCLGGRPGEGARHRAWRAQGGSEARGAMAIRRARGRMGLARSAVCEGGPRAAAAGSGLAYEHAGVFRVRAGRLRDERRLVSAAQEVHPARAPRSGVGARRHAAGNGNYRRAPAQARERARRAAPVLRPRAQARMKPYDAIIIGGGHSGLVCAAYLARSGRRVLVLERRERLGGAAVSEEVFPGFRFSVFSYVVSLLRPEIIRELELPGHAVHVLPLESTLTPLADGNYLAQWSDHDRNRRELARHSLRDAESYDEYGLRMHHMARAVKPLLAMAPPDPASLSPRDLLGMASPGGHLPSLGRERFHEL